MVEKKGINQKVEGDRDERADQETRNALEKESERETVEKEKKQEKWKSNIEVKERKRMDS